MPTILGFCDKILWKQSKFVFPRLQSAAKKKSCDHLINSISKSPVDMTGLSRRSITRATEQLHFELKRSKNAEVQHMIEALKNLCKREDNLVSASHDIWSSIAGRSFMGLNLHVMDVSHEITSLAQTV